MIPFDDIAEPDSDELKSKKIKINEQEEEIYKIIDVVSRIDDIYFEIEWKMR